MAVLFSQSPHLLWHPKEQFIGEGICFCTTKNSDFVSVAQMCGSIFETLGFIAQVGVRVFEDDLSPATAELLDSEIQRLLEVIYVKIPQHIIRSIQFVPTIAGISCPLLSCS